MKNTLITCKYRYRGEDIVGMLLSDVASYAISQGLPVTFDKRYMEPNFKPGKGVTPFEEIEIIPVEETDNPKKLGGILNVSDKWDGDLQSYSLALYDAVKEHYKNVWNTDRKTIIWHSAGYDSRIMSCALMDLRNDGFDLGEIQFICHDPEGPDFIKIMELQGWDKSQYTEFSPKDKTDYYDIGMRSPNGFLPLSSTLNFDREITGGNTTKFNLVTGLGGGEIFNYTSAGMGPYKTHYHCKNPFINRWLNNFLGNHELASQLSQDYGQLILPFFSYEYLYIAAKCPDRFLKVFPKTKHGNNQDYVRDAILKRASVDLSHIPWGRHDYDWNVSKKRQEEMRKFWNGCTFRRHLGMHKNLQVIKPHPKKPGRQVVGDHDSRIFGFALLYEKVFGT